MRFLMCFMLVLGCMLMVGCENKEMKKCLDDNEKLTTENTNLNETITGMLDKLSEEAKQRHAQEQLLNKATQEKTQLQADNTGLKKNLADTKNKAASSEAKVKSLQAQVQKLTKDVEALTKKTKADEAAKAKIAQILDATTKQKEQLQKRVAELENKPK